MYIALHIKANLERQKKIFTHHIDDEDDNDAIMKEVAIISALENA